LDPAKVAEITNKVFHWQINHHPKSAWNNRWLNATLYNGITDIARAFNDDTYWEAALEWATHVEWKTGERAFNADDYACAYTYLELYQRYGESYMTASAIDAINTIRESDIRGRELWSWSDALFMGPPVLAKLGTVTGDTSYYRMLNEKFWDAQNFLYDEEEHLFYRDAHYFGLRDVRGNKVFWLRGNGWVAAGLVKILEDLPVADRRYHDYLVLYRQMMARIVTLQGSDGLWRTNLLTPEAYPEPETSGSALFCYALTWGVNQDILREEMYAAALVNCWEGLTSHIDENGKLKWVQGVAQRPGPVSEEHSEIYATGAFLMVAGEMYKLAQDKYR
jgi:rhamnogalacturonyl hydrolase YesR